MTLYVKLDFGFAVQLVLTTDRPAPGPALGPRRPFWELTSKHVQCDIHTFKLNERYRPLNRLSVYAYILLRCDNSNVEHIFSHIYQYCQPLCHAKLTLERRDYAIKKEINY
jgi:hypothetical protein